MNDKSLSYALSMGLDAPPGPAEAGHGRAEFQARFAAELARLEARRQDLDSGQADSLLSALGAAGVREWELALAFLDAAAGSPARTRRAALSVGVLRRRFQLVMSVAR